MVARIHVGYVGRIPGFSVVGTAHGGRAAITSVEELRPDLVLLDVYMADMSGLGVLHHLRGLAHPVDILMITAANDMDTVRAALRAGVVNYLVKPFTAAELTERLDQYAQSRRRLAMPGPAVQEDIDRLFGGTNRAVLPKGLSTATCALVADALRTNGGDLSAAETAAVTGLSRVSARRYLEYLCATGQAELRPRYGTAGRPEHRYRWTT
ncbi:transcriptional regulatory protein [Herbidospora sp. NBRC 101105]|nr:transcriptional regulatory protein [Herbidospora sp. NBRC 101105]